MGRPIYPYELDDPDFTWLMSNFQENFPNYSYSESSSLPVVFVKTSEQEDYVSSAHSSEEVLDDEAEITK